MAKYFTKEGDDYKEVEAFNQDEVNDIVGKRVEREREKFADYEDLKTKASSIDTVKAEYETKLSSATNEVTELKKQIGSAKLETDKVKLMHEFKLPDDMAEFVTGENVEEMRKRAEKLAKGVKSTVPVQKQGKPKDGQQTNAKAIAGNLFGKKSDD